MMMTDIVVDPVPDLIQGTKKDQEIIGNTKKGHIIPTIVSHQTTNTTDTKEAIVKNEVNQGIFPFN